MSESPKSHPENVAHHTTPTPASTSSFYKYLIITVILVVLIGAALIFTYFTLQKNKASQIKAPTNLSPTIPYKEQYQNPFGKKTQYQNPFENKEEKSQNPFDNLK